MLRIAENQRIEFMREQRSTFEIRMINHIGRRFPAQARARSSSALRLLVRAAVAEAAAYGIVLEYDVRRYVEHIVSYGPNFVDTPSLAAVLRDPELDGTAKMDLIDDIEAFKDRS